MKLPGVESAVVSLDKASADIRLAAGNRITMPQLRALLKNNGYPTRDAQVEARGKFIDVNGTLVFDLLNGSTMPVAPDPKGTPVRAGPQPVDITGVSRADGKTAEKVTPMTIR